MLVPATKPKVYNGSNGGGFLIPDVESKMDAPD